MEMSSWEAPRVAMATDGPLASVIVIANVSLDLSGHPVAGRELFPKCTDPRARRWTTPTSPPIVRPAALPATQDAARRPLTRHHHQRMRQILENVGGNTEGVGSFGDGGAGNAGIAAGTEHQHRHVTAAARRGRSRNVIPASLRRIPARPTAARGGSSRPVYPSGRARGGRRRASPLPDRTAATPTSARTSVGCRTSPRACSRRPCGGTEHISTAPGTARSTRTFWTIIPPIEWPISTGGAGSVSMTRTTSAT